MTTPGLVDAATLGGLSRADLAAALRPLWEDAGPLVDALVGRAVRDWDEHLDVAEAAIAAMGDDERAALLGAHPRIGAPPEALAAAGTLSYEEQGGARRRDAATTARLAELNERYEAEHGFPFVAWVAGRPPEAMVAVIEARLGRDRHDELDAGSAALVAIARDRWRRLRSAPS